MGRDSKEPSPLAAAPQTPPTPTLLSAHDERRLAVHLHRDPRAIRNAYRGTAKPVVIEHVREGARELGLPLPDAASQGGSST